MQKPTRKEVLIILKQAFAENPQIIFNVYNGGLIGEYIDQYHPGDFSIATVRQAITALSFPVNRFKLHKPEPEPFKIETTSAEEINRIMAQIFRENPTLAPTKENQEIIGRWMDEHNCVRFDLETVRKVVSVIGYANGLPENDPFERQRPPAPPPPQPVASVEPQEVLEPGQLSIHASEWELRGASPAQLKDFLRRSHAAGKK